jgi:hypothetical protein
MGSSGWEYVVAYQPDPQVAFEALQAKVLAEGDYWWAARDGAARDFPDRPGTIDELFADETVQQAGTGSILDMERVLAEGEPPNYGWLAVADDFTSEASIAAMFGAPATVTPASAGDIVAAGVGRMFAQHREPEYGTVVPVTAAEAREATGVEKLTRDHLAAIEDLAVYRGFGRCAVLHDAAGEPDGLYFWGRSGD